MLSKDEAFKLVRFSYEDLKSSASAIRDENYSNIITYSPKAYVPVTHLCRNSCAYCAFVKDPNSIKDIYTDLSDITQTCNSAIEMNCAEALIALGEFPEEKYEVAREWLHNNGYNSTIDYVLEVSKFILENFNLLPNTNCGSISSKNIVRLKEYTVSQGMLLETIAGRLSEPGGPHFECPDKSPALRLSTLEAAGRAKIPFSTGILVGIGETRSECIEALLAIRELHLRFNHIQEVIVQKFVPQRNTAMENYPACDDEEHLWAISAARLIFQNSTHIQAPSNLTDSIADLINAGIDDLGGISPINPDFANPDYAWPHLGTMKIQINEIGKELVARAPIYPEYIDKPGFVHENVLPYLKSKVNNKNYLLNEPLSKNNVFIDLTDDEETVSRPRDRNLPVKHK